MRRDARVADEVGCEMFGREQSQGHVKAWCASFTKAMRGRGVQVPQGLGVRGALGL